VLTEADIDPHYFWPGAIYVGAAPEYGKETFFNRMKREIDHVRRLASRGLRDASAPAFQEERYVRIRNRQKTRGRVHAHGDGL
jgi:hypothetical protein